MVDKYPRRLRVNILVRPYLDRHALPGAAPLGLREIYQRAPEGKDDLPFSNGPSGEDSASQVDSAM